MVDDSLSNTDRGISDLAGLAAAVEAPTQPDSDSQPAILNFAGSRRY